MTELIFGAIGAFISGAFKYIPALAKWYYSEKLEDWRGLIMLGLVLASGLILFLIPSCLGFENTVVCDKQGIYDFVKLLFVGFSTNQFTYLVTPKSKYKTQS